MFTEEQIVVAQMAAKARLEHCFAELYDLIDIPEDGCECLGAFCGCETCIVREVLDAIIKALGDQ